MFKSIFSRYLATFTIIIAICFLVLILVTTSMLTNNAIDTKQTLMQKSAANTELNLNIYMEMLQAVDVGNLKDRSGKDLTRNLKTTAILAELDIYVADLDGSVLFTSVDGAEGTAFDARVVDSILANAESYAISDVGGYFTSKHMNSFRVYTYAERQQAIIVVSSANIGNSNFANRITITLITVSLWVFLSAMISVYFISKRVSEPIQQISQAAKNFAKGDFSKKVEVTGQDEIAMLGRTFNNMAASLEHMDEIRSSFVANVSHDLRTPMTTIAGFVDGIRDGTIPPEKHDYYLGIISDEVRRLSRLVNTLLEISRMESKNNFTMTDFNLSEKARHIILSFEKRIDDKKIEVEFNSDEDVFVHADGDAIHQVLYNLTDNAVKFTSEGGVLSITIGVTNDKKEKKAVFTIRNTGEGIPKEELPYVFERFYKSDRSRGLDKTGTGLGLYIVKTSLEGHGSEIKVQSEAGAYTEFSFQLPLAERPGERGEGRLLP